MLSTRTQILLSLSFLTSACGSGGTDPGDGDGDDASEGSDALPASCAGLVGEGNAVGQIAENWTLLDRDGFEVHLHDYCGKVIYIENGAEW